MRRAHDAEVAAVNGGDVDRVELLGDCDDERVGGTEWQVGVLFHQVGGPIELG